ncbi:hypothetical protein EC973_001649 [Apophysomyces ossiformis]|uniref:Uncharacterized protein n=1 Tax=Apophysomyces ossiformis TaxID=679940 RepID=A0A8H7BYJ3_9FUNG|nr:hypothetical protein EC973_001649 [Apophysomyces ossiformis]
MLITDRDQFLTESIQRFTQRHFAGIFDAVHLCSLVLTDANDTEADQKALICREIRANLFITDSCQNALECATAGTDVILYDPESQRLCNCANNDHSSTTCSLKRIPHWKDLAIYFRKPRSPLHQCHYPEDFIDNDEEEADLLEENYSSVGHYETIEIEEWSDDEEPEEILETEPLVQEDEEEDSCSSEDTESGSIHIPEKLFLMEHKHYQNIMLEAVLR